jgi:hypothetical protein
MLLSMLPRLHTRLRRKQILLCLSQRLRTTQVTTHPSLLAFRFVLAVAYNVLLKDLTRTHRPTSHCRKTLWACMPNSMPQETAKKNSGYIVFNFSPVPSVYLNEYPSISMPQTNSCQIYHQGLHLAKVHSVKFAYWLMIKSQELCFPMLQYSREGSCQRHGG